MSKTGPAVDLVDPGPLLRLEEEGTNVGGSHHQVQAVLLVVEVVEDLFDELGRKLAEEVVAGLGG